MAPKRVIVILVVFMEQILDGDLFLILRQGG